MPPSRCAGAPRWDLTPGRPSGPQQRQSRFSRAGVCRDRYKELPKAGSYFEELAFGINNVCTEPEIRDSMLSRRPPWSRGDTGLTDLVLPNAARLTTIPVSGRMSTSNVVRRTGCCISRRRTHASEGNPRSSDLASFPNSTCILAELSRRASALGKVRDRGSAIFSGRFPAPTSRS